MFISDVKDNVPVNSNIFGCNYLSLAPFVSSAKFNKKFGSKKSDGRKSHSDREGKRRDREGKPRSGRHRKPLSDRGGHQGEQHHEDDGEDADNEEVFEPPFDKVRGGSRAENEAKEDDRMKTFFRDSQKVIRDIIGSLKFTVYSFLMTKLITICCPEVLRVC